MLELLTTPSPSGRTDHVRQLIGGELRDLGLDFEVTRRGALIAELPMAVECRLVSYDPESCRMVGEIVNVCAEEGVLTDGRIDPAKLRPITFDGQNNEYLVLGEKVGDAFSDGLRLK